MLKKYSRRCSSPSKQNLPVFKIKEKVAFNSEATEACKANFFDIVTCWVSLVA
jgi:hypothetical protein